MTTKTTCPYHATLALFIYLCGERGLDGAPRDTPVILYVMGYDDPNDDGVDKSQPSIKSKNILIRRYGL